MDIYEAWEKALKKTEIIRARVQALKTFQDTHVPYVMLSESSINVGDTVVRRGDLVVEKPSLILPPNTPQFEGFDFDEGLESKEEEFINFLLVRGVNLPSYRYNNSTSSLDVFEGKLSQAIKHYEELLQQQENISTGLVVGPEDCWQFSLLVFTFSQVTKNANLDIKKIIEKYNKNNERR